LKLSVSSYNKFNSCNRLYWIEKVEGYQDLTPKPWLEFGSAFGNLMAYVDVHGFDKGMEHIDELFNDPFIAAEVAYLLAVWNKKFESKPEPVIEVAGQPGNEFEIELDLSHMVNDRFELIFTGFIDKVFEKDGEPHINERKTTSDPINNTSIYWSRLNFDPQIVGYSWGLSEILGTSVEKGTYEVFRKPKVAVDSKLFKRGTDALAYREKLLAALSTEVSRKAEMVARKPYFISNELRANWLHEFIAVAESIHDKKIFCKDLENPQYEWARNKDTCDLYLPCVYKEYCGCSTNLEDMDMIIKKESK